MLQERREKKNHVIYAVVDTNVFVSAFITKNHPIREFIVTLSEMIEILKENKLKR